ncbi:DUF4132 domain-containing protein [Streptomyces sp. NBC_00669]|uniref:DUF7737 domain-containing protein n=1 Tax=Streptomyces sp. NBC_00669 TaxID=2976011 RepID=UPI002E355399|nr:DUF4132 domain-containing protein [Streptomyces sp. NBC_00669]
MSAVPATDEVAHRLGELLARSPGPLRQLADEVPFDVPVELHTFLQETFGPGSYGLHECWDAAARAVLERPVTPERTALLRSLLLGNGSGFRGWELIRLVQGLYDAGALDDDVLHPLLRVRHRSWELCPVDPARREQPHFHDRPALWDEASAGCRDRIADSLDRFVDLLCAAPTAESVRQLPPWRPRGTRFFLRALELWRAETTAPGGDRARGTAAVYLAQARLTEAEQVSLLDELGTRPRAEREAAVALAAAAREQPLDLLELLDAADARPLARLIRAGVAPVDPESDAIDLGALRRVELPAERMADLLPLLCATATTVTADLAGLGAGSVGAADDLPEFLLARYGLNEPRVRERLRRHAYSAIACLGLLPLTAGETVLDRYLELRGCAKAATRFGAERRANHLRAVHAGLWHLAQVTGYPSADRLEWDMEARLATDTPQRWSIGAYTLAADLADPAVPLRVERAGKRLASVPKQVRQDPSYGEIRAVQERLREQARRVRTGLIEPLVAGGDLLDAAAFDRLLALPAARAMLSALVLRTAGGVFGLLDLSGAAPALVGLDGVPVPIGAGGGAGVGVGIGAAHPLDLAARDLLGGWQREVVRRRIQQPVKQVFREWYRLTAAEREDGTWSLRFAGRDVAGAVAGRLLTARGWRASVREDQPFATRRLGGCHAVLRFDELGHFLGEGSARTGPTGFVETVDGPGHSLVLGAAVPLARVPALDLSEALRDVDLVVSVAARQLPSEESPSDSAAAVRAALLAALVADLGLDRVTLDGRYARVRGTRADYRVHLGSGSVHVDPGGHLCIVPAGLTRTPHRDLFLPFADDDEQTSVILSKVLLLADDEHITDQDILGQIAYVSAPVDR